MELTFGKYKGRHIKDVPKAYLDWLKRTVEMDAPLQAAVEEALKAYAEKCKQILEPEVEEKPDRIKQVYRELSKQFHPDKGGTNEAMAAVNEFYQRLMAGQNTEGLK